MNNNYLQYTGKGRIIIDIIKKGKKENSRRRVPTSLVSMNRRFFEDNDIIDDKSIAYYNELKSLNVNLILNDIETISVNGHSQVEEIVNEGIESVETSKEPEEVAISGNSEAESNSSDLNEVDETEEVDSEEIESLTEEVDSITEDQRIELVAFLDATYDKYSLKQLATELGVQFNSRISSEKLIDKLIEEKSSEILEMMK